MNKIYGQHYIVELIGCDPSTLTHIASVEADMLEAARASGAHIIAHHFHQFSPHGVSGVILIGESHFTIHTWPEDAYAAIDFFTCGSMDPEKALAVMKEHFKASDARIQKLERGY